MPRYSQTGDAWLLGLLVINHPQEVKSLPFEEIVKAASKVMKVDRQKNDAKEMIVVRLRFDTPPDGSDDTWEVEVFFDPSVNYLVKKVVKYYINHKRVDIEEVISFKDMGSGIFFPTHVTGMCGVPDKFDTTRSEAILTEIQVNELLPAEIFRVEYPEGTPLTDAIRGTFYRVNKSGEAISKEYEIGRTSPPPPMKSDNSTAPSPAPSPSSSETREEPRDHYYLVMLSSIGLIVIGLALSLRRWWKAKSSNSV